MNTPTALAADNELTPCQTFAWCSGHDSGNPETEDWHMGNGFGWITDLDEVDGQDVALISDRGSFALNIDSHILATMPLADVARFSGELRNMADQLDKIAAHAAQVTAE